MAGQPGPDGFTELAADDVTRALQRLTGWAIDERIDLEGLEVIRPSLEDVYLDLTESAGTAGLDEPTAKRRARHAS